MTLPTSVCVPACNAARMISQTSGRCWRRSDDVETTMTAAVPWAVAGPCPTTRTSGPGVLAVPAAVPRG